MIKGVIAGILMGAVLSAGGLYFYFVSGRAPAAVKDPPMALEHKLLKSALHAHIDAARTPAPPIQPSEEDYDAAATIYKENCSMCHGLPDQPAPPMARNIFPDATLLFKGKGVTNNPPQESYWKIANGIRLTGMPAFKTILNDTQMWQLALLVANAHRIPDSAKTILKGEASVGSEAAVVGSGQAVR